MEENKKISIEGLFMGYVLDEQLKPYNINKNVDWYICHNDKKLYEEYGSIIPAKVLQNSEGRPLVVKWENGTPLTCILSEDIIIAIKNILNNDDTKNINYIYFKKEHLSNLDFINITKQYKNITPKEIGLLALYVNNNEYFEKYLEMLDSCNENVRELILKIFEPYSFKLLNNAFMDRRSVLPEFKKYLIDDTKENDIEWCKKFYNYDFYEFSTFKPKSKYTNIYFYKEFEYYFVKLYELFNEIIKKENCIDILNKIIKFKECTFENIPVITGDLREETREEFYGGKIAYVGGRWIDWEEPECKSYIETYDTRDFKEKETLSMKKILTYMLGSLVEEKINYRDLIGFEPGLYTLELLNIFEEKSKVKKLCK